MRCRGFALAIAVVAAPAFAQSYGQPVYQNAPVQQLSPRAKGVVRNHDVHNSVTVNPFALFSAPGADLQYERSFSDKFSGLLGARIQPGRDINPYALTLGGDFFLLGRRNEGLFLGPRVILGLGSALGTGFNANSSSILTNARARGLPGRGTGGAQVIGSGASAVPANELMNAMTSGGDFRDAAGAEVGYRWISSQGLTLGLGAGITYGFGSELLTAVNPSGVANRWQPYGLFNVGWSW